MTSARQLLGVPLLASIATLAAVVPSAVAAHSPQTVAPPAEGAGSVCDFAALLPTEVDGIPETPVGEQFNWMLTVGETDEATVTEHFSEEFLAAVPPADVIALLADVASVEPTVVSVATRGEYGLEVLIDSTQGQAIVSFDVEPEPPHRIVGLLFQSYENPSTTADGTTPTGTTAAGVTTAAGSTPAGTATDGATGVDGLEAQLAALPGTNTLYVATITDGAVAPVVELGSTDPQPVGSAFKLWVLATLASQIEAGTVAWDDAVTITPELKSVPSGVLQECPDASTVTVDEAATLMISISDNTATDVLIDLVGVEAVEATMVEIGVGQASLDATLPLLTTKQMTQLKTGDPAALEAYVAAPVDERRAVLAALGTETPELSAAWDAPRAIDTVEWFATGPDIAATYVALDELAARPGLEPVATVLSTNPGLVTTDGWSRTWFKGGSEPGVFALTYLLTRDDGAQFVVVGSFADTEAVVDDQALGALVESAVVYTATL